MTVQPIGIFDSGVGGLSVLKHVQHLLPRENIIYVADSAYTPYGCKSHEMVKQRSIVITEFLLKQGAKVIVLACNTATAYIIEELRQCYDVPFIGVEPGIKPAIKQSKTAHIGILATQNTIDSTRYAKLIKSYDDQAVLYHQACPGLAEQVENAHLNDPATYQLLSQYLSVFLSQPVDTIVLGCTHYSFLHHQIEQIMNNSITIIDTSYAVAEQVVRVVREHQLENKQAIRKVSYFSSGSKDQLGKAIEHLLKQKVIVYFLDDCTKLSNNN